MPRFLSDQQILGNLSAIDKTSIRVWLAGDWSFWQGDASVARWLSFPSRPSGDGPPVQELRRAPCVRPTLIPAAIADFSIPGECEEYAPEPHRRGKRIQGELSQPGSRARAHGATHPHGDGCVTIAAAVKPSRPRLLPQPYATRFLPAVTNPIWKVMRLEYV